MINEKHGGDVDRGGRKIDNERLYYVRARAKCISFLAISRPLLWYANPIWLLHPLYDF